MGSMGSLRYLWWSSGGGSSGDGDDAGDDSKKGGGRGRGKGKRGDKSKEDKKKSEDEEEAPVVTTVEGDGRIVDLEEDGDPGRNVSVAANSPDVGASGCWGLSVGGWDRAYSRSTCSLRCGCGYCGGSLGRWRLDGGGGGVSGGGVWWVVGGGGLGGWVVQLPSWWALPL
jgi:hypothetical protein